LNRDTEDAAVRPFLLLCAPIEEIVVVLVRFRSEGAPFVRAVDALTLLHMMALLFGQRFVRVEVDAPGPAMLVVDRDPDMAAKRMVPEGRDQRKPGEQPLGDAPVVGIGLTLAASEES